MKLTVIGHDQYGVQCSQRVTSLKVNEKDHNRHSFEAGSNEAGANSDFPNTETSLTSNEWNVKYD
jgi:hypothetical protein